MIIKKIYIGISLVLMNLIPNTKKSVTYDLLKTFNPNVNVDYVKLIDKTIIACDLPSDKQSIELLIGQIVSESRARHFRKGEIIKSHTGAIGICQILPSTALDYIDRVFKTDQFDTLDSLGASEVSLLRDKTINRSTRLVMSKKWLKKANNNIALWGLIMKHRLRNKNLVGALISYNTGEGGFRKYVRNGNKIESHHYMKLIRKNINYIKKRLSN